jgi:hypothetical protein
MIMDDIIVNLLGFHYDNFIIIMTIFSPFVWWDDFALWYGFENNYP